MDSTPFDWLLLLTSANKRDLGEAYELARTLVAAKGTVEIGVTIHGVRTISEARGAFEYLSRISLERLGLSLVSYGLLVDDLHVYRAIAAQRPIGLAHPQAPATRALTDVARLLYEDARSRVLG
jgi:MinD-like ATPase involved in chromosome partitioning or flagellar assembly